MKSELYLTKIKEYLNRRAMLSHEITDMLIKDFNISKDNARKIISNFVKESKLYRFDNLIFDSGSRLIYKENNNDKFLSAIKIYKPYINEILFELDSNKVISRFLICKIASASIYDKSIKRKYDDIVEEIRLYRMIKYYKQYIIYASLSDTECNNYIRSVENKDRNNLRTIASIVNMHLNMNIIIRNNLNYRSESFLMPTYLDNVFDIVALSKCFGSKDSDCICLYDVNVTTKVTELVIKSFFIRIQNVANNKANSNKVIGFMVYMDITEDAIKFAKQHALVLIDICKLFGKKIKIIYDKISDLSIIDLRSEDAKEVLELIENSGQSENLGNIKGELFERIIHNIVKEVYSESSNRIDRKIIFNYDEKTSREIDIIIDSSRYNEIILIECKSSNNKIPLGYYNKNEGSITKDSVKYFYDVYSKYSEKNPDKNIKFVFFAANGFDEIAKNTMDDYSTKIKAHKLDFYYDYTKAKDKLLPEYKEIKDDIECWKRYFISSNKN